MGSAVPELDALRGRLDRLDQQLLATLRDRIRCCVDIAVVKQANQVPMMQPHRIGYVKQRAAEFGLANDIDVEFLSNLYDLVIAETCRVEDIVMSPGE